MAKNKTIKKGVTPMNENYTTTATLANIHQIAFDTVLLLDPTLVDVPSDRQQIMNDIQAVLQRCLKTAEVINV